MKTRSRVLIVLVVSGVMLVALLSSHTPSGATGSNAATDLTLQTAMPHDPVVIKPEEARQVLIRGQVLNGRARLRVQVVGRDGLVVDETRTDPEGRFYFSPLPAGHYTLQVLSESGKPLALEPQADTRVWPEHSETPIEYILPLAAPSPGADAGQTTGLPGQTGAKQAEIIQANGYITGVVTAADTGFPQYLYVYVYNNSGVFQIYGLSDYVTGIYSITVPPGTYRVYFKPFFGDYAPEWYNNRRDFASATPVVVGDGAIVANINAALDVGGQIGGRVTAASGGAPISGVYVYAYTSTTSTSYVGYEYTDATGVYTITGLLAGTYYLEFETSSGSEYLSEYYNNKLSLAAADGIAVTLGGVVGGINAALEVGGKITGKVTVRVEPLWGTSPSRCTPARPRTRSPMNPVTLRGCTRLPRCSRATIT
jgi:hypothetical protein